MLRVGDMNSSRKELINFLSNTPNDQPENIQTSNIIQLGYVILIYLGCMYVCMHVRIIVNKKRQLIQKKDK